MSINAKSVVTQIIIAGWLVASLIGLMSFANSGLKTFDHSGNLHTLATQHNFETLFAKKLQFAGYDTRNKLFHFSDNGCWCAFLGSPHITTVKTLATNLNIDNLNLSVNDLNKDIQQFIPSIPAVAYFNAAGKLIYLGPYSSGFYCGEGNGLIEPFLTQKLKTPEDNAMLPMDAQGCYCQT